MDWYKKSIIYIWTCFGGYKRQPFNLVINKFDMSFKLRRPKFKSILNVLT